MNILFKNLYLVDLKTVIQGGRPYSSPFSISRQSFVNVRLFHSNVCVVYLHRYATQTSGLYKLKSRLK